MIEKYYYEFAKIYSRLMRLELQAKQRATTALLAYYKQDVLNVFDKFLNNRKRLERYKTKNGNPIRALLKNPNLNPEQKFTHIVNQLYLSDTLFLVLCCKQFEAREVTEKFYFKSPEKFQPFIEGRHLLCDLRNAIAHYNIKDFEKNKKKYLDTLLLFEIHIVEYATHVMQLPKFNSKPSVKSILLSIHKVRPDLLEVDPKKEDEMEYHYNKHRILVDLVDEIALYNNYSIDQLPSPWTILRQMYDVKKELVANATECERQLSFDIK